MQIMIAQHHYCGIVQLFYEAQYQERVRTAVDQVSHQPQLVFRFVETDQVEEFPGGETRGQIVRADRN